MRTPLGKRITAACLGALVSLSVSSWAMQHRGEMDQDPGRMLTHMAQRLDLTDEQQNQLRAVMDKDGEAAAADRARLGELRGQLRAMQGNFDPGAARKIADEIGEITGRMVYRFASTYAEFYGLLTDDQKAQLEQLQEERDERRDRWQKPPRPNQD